MEIVARWEEPIIWSSQNNIFPFIFSGHARVGSFGDSMKKTMMMTMEDLRNWTFPTFCNSSFVSLHRDHYKTHILFRKSSSDRHQNPSYQVTHSSLRRQSQKSRPRKDKFNLQFPNHWHLPPLSGCEEFLGSFSISSFSSTICVTSTSFSIPSPLEPPLLLLLLGHEDEALQIFRAFIQ